MIDAVMAAYVQQLMKYDLAYHAACIGTFMPMPLDYDDAQQKIKQLDWKQQIGFDDMHGAESAAQNHIPVMLKEVCDYLGIKSGDVICDGTFGAGGYSKALLDQGARIIAIDQDPNVIRDAAPFTDIYQGRLALHHGKFADLLDVVDEQSLDGFVIDIGVSSMQIDQAARGFSFLRDGPLDMRMGQAGVSAADVINQLPANELARIFGFYGEEKKAGRIARAIQAARSIEPIVSTLQLAKLIEKTAPRRAQDRIHPATRVFQALRIYVNDELGQLAKALLAAERALKPGGRMVVVTFHSLEDRIVKRFFADRFGKQSGSRHLPPQAKSDVRFELIGKKAVITASKQEADKNPRARSAKLRAGLRTSAPNGSDDMSIFGLPKLYPLNKILERS